MKRRPGSMPRFIVKAIVEVWPDMPTYAVPPTADKASALRRYRAAVEAIRVERKVCESCGGTPAAVSQKRLYGHHLLPVVEIAGGLSSPLATHPANMLLLCNRCHELFHPGRREYSWSSSGRQRGQALRGAR